MGDNGQLRNTQYNLTIKNSFNQKLKNILSIDKNMHSVRTQIKKDSYAKLEDQKLERQIRKRDNQEQEYSFGIFKPKKVSIDCDPLETFRVEQKLSCTKQKSENILNVNQSINSSIDTEICRNQLMNRKKWIQNRKSLYKKTLVPRIKIKSFKKFNQLAQSVISKIEPSLQCLMSQNESRDIEKNQKSVDQFQVANKDKQLRKQQKNNNNMGKIIQKITNMVFDNSIDSDKNIQQVKQWKQVKSGREYPLLRLSTLNMDRKSRLTCCELQYDKQKYNSCELCQQDLDNSHKTQYKSRKQKSRKYVNKMSIDRSSKQNRQGQVNYNEYDLEKKIKKKVSTTNTNSSYKSQFSRTNYNSHVQTYQNYKHQLKQKGTQNWNTNKLNAQMSSQDKFNDRYINESYSKIRQQQSVENRNIYSAHHKIENSSDTGPCERMEQGLTHIHQRKRRVTYHSYNSQEKSGQLNQDNCSQQKQQNRLENKQRKIGNRKNKMMINYSKFLPILPQSSAQQKYSWSSSIKLFCLKDVLGIGANASVRQAQCFGNKYAVKIYEKVKICSRAKKDRVYTQIKILNEIPKHPNIISVIQAYQNRDQIHIIFEYVENAKTLKDYFMGKKYQLGQKQLRKIFYKIVKGVAHLHNNGICHRDLKPANIIISFDQDSQMIVKIIDFGTATNRNKSDVHCGTPNFMSPELVLKNKQSNLFAADVWAVGIIMFYLSEGRYPFTGHNQNELYLNIRNGNYQFKKMDVYSHKLKGIIGDCLELNPMNRISIQQLSKNQWFLQ